MNTPTNINRLNTIETVKYKTAMRKILNETINKSY